MAVMELDALEYDAEVAYIIATSPVQADYGNRSSRTSMDFDFAEKQPKNEQKSPQSMASAQDASTKLRSSKVPSVVVSSPTHSISSGPLSPILASPDYTLDQPSTPTSKLKLIQEAQASPPSPKASPGFKSELESGKYKYRTVVVYGQAGCGKTNFVEKLVHSNPAIFARVVSSTTRKKRPNEVPGIDFHYISQKEMSLAIAKGEFMEYVQLQKKIKKIKRAAVSEQDLQKTPTKERRATTADFPTEVTPPGITDQKQRSSSKFDLTEEDSPMIGGEFIGTTKQALAEATQQGKPCVVLNVSISGAQQLKKRGLTAAYVFLHSSSTGKPPKSDALTPDIAINADHLNSYNELHDYVMQLIQDLQLAQSTRYEITKHEWDALPTVKLETTEVPSGPQVRVRIVSFAEVLAHYQSISFNKEREQAKAELPKQGIFSKAKLNKKLHDERLLVFTMANCLPTDKDKLHLPMLQTIYAKLTSRNIKCRKIGAHWNVVGFSGVDPTDDLQEVGILGLAQLIYFLEDPKTSELAFEMYQSVKGQNIQFCCLSFQMTQTVLAALRDGGLTKIANKQGRVLMLANEFYVATMYHFFTELDSWTKEMGEVDILFRRVQEYCCKHSKEVLSKLGEYLKMKKQSQLAPSVLIESEPKPFTPLDDYSDV